MARQELNLTQKELGELVAVKKKHLFLKLRILQQTKIYDYHESVWNTRYKCECQYGIEQPAIDILFIPITQYKLHNIHSAKIIKNIIFPKTPFCRRHTSEYLTTIENSLAGQYLLLAFEYHIQTSFCTKKT
ncbi:MAG TPA: hypothetical protein PKA54_03025 [Chitinophagaceae bacterium]|nr:MAG: hypothetical protein UZ11_BCD004000338 [Bacteroidetes bacterium OLB11]HMN32321.1 hypothetical protein [Chitinophagaceae bacterium]